MVEFLKNKVHNVFLFLSIIIGVLYLIVTPPFQVPDEVNHFYKSYQIANGDFLTKKNDNRLGGFVPTSFVKITEPFLHLRWNTSGKTQFSSIKEQFSVKLNEETKSFVDFPNAAVYSPVSYLPQSLIVLVLKTFDAPPLFIYYGVKLFMLIFWSFCIWYSIKIVPIYKWLFSFLALLPMSIYINSSLSADVVTNILGFIFIAIILKLYYSSEKINIKDFLLVLLVAVLLASAKFVYVPIVFLFFLLNKKRIEKIGSFYIGFTVLIIVSFFTALFWSSIIGNIYIPYNDYNIIYRDGLDLVKCANLHEQVSYISKNGIYIFEVFVKSMISSFHMYYKGYVGTFGWVDTQMPFLVVNVTYVFIFLIAFFENNNGYIFKLKQKIFVILIVVATICLILLSQHLTWDCVGSNTISTIQGRYFIPVFPLLFILLSNSVFNKYNLSLVIVFSIVLLSSFSLFTIYKRYYVDDKFTVVKISCDLENVNQENKFTTNIKTVVLENGAAQSSNFSRSFNNSIKLHSGDPFGLTYKTKGLKQGDEINIEVWRLGNAGEIVLSGESGKLFYESNKGFIEKDSKGWERLILNFKIPNDIIDKEVGIYLYNTSSDTSYFDDFIIIKKTILQ